MHILTKIFVVLAALLAVLLSALTITYSINAERITASYTDAQREKAVADAALRTQQTNHDLETAQLRESINDRDQELGTVRSERDRLRLEGQALAAEKREAEARAEATNAQVAQSLVMVDTLTRLVETYRDEVALLRENELRNRDQRLDLEGTIADQESRLQVFDQTVRALREQLADAQQMIQQFGGARPASASAQAPQRRTIPGPTIYGRVDNVQADAASGKTLVQVNLGTNDGVQPNTELYVVRNREQYIGTIVVDRADLQISVASVSLTNTGQAVRAGDEVWSRLSGSN